MKIKIMILSMFLCGSLMQASQDGNRSPQGIDYNLSDEDVTVSKGKKADNGNKVVKKSQDKQDEHVAILQRSIDEQALYDKVLHLSDKYNNLVQNPANSRDVVKIVKGSVVKINPVQDSLKNLHDAAQLLEVVQLYNSAPGNQYRDQYSNGALDKDNQELQYLLDLRNSMIVSHSLPDKNDQAYTSEMMDLVQKYGYSIKNNNVYDDTLDAIEDRIINLLVTRARAAARKNSATKVQPKEQYHDEYSGMNPSLDAKLKEVDDQINRTQVNAQHGIISKDKAKLKLDDLSSQRNKILQERKDAVAKMQALLVPVAPQLDPITLPSVLSSTPASSPTSKNNTVSMNNILYTIKGLGKNQRIEIAKTLPLISDKNLKDATNLEDLHYVDTDRSDDGIEEID